MSGPRERPAPFAAVRDVAMSKAELAHAQWFIPSDQRPRHFADTIERGMRVLLWVAFSVFCAVLARATVTFATGGGFASEGPAIIGLATLLPLALWAVALRYRWRMRDLEAQIERGELRLGLWLTPTDVIHRDLDEGLSRLRRSDVASVETYISIRPPVSLVVLRSPGNQTLRIAADWLAGYRGRVEVLRAELAERLLLPAEWAMALDAFFATGGAATGPDRWTALCDLLEELRLRHRQEMTSTTYEAVLGVVAGRISRWPAAECVAADTWWQRFVSDGEWEAGVGGVGAATTYFDGFLSGSRLDWRMPLARRAVFCGLPLWANNEGAFASFRETDAFDHLEELDLGEDVGAGWLRQVVDTPRFEHLERLSVVPHAEVPDALHAELAAWRRCYGVG